MLYIFLIFGPKHRLWVLVTTASARRFSCVLTTYVLREKNNEIIIFFTSAYCMGKFSEYKVLLLLFISIENIAQNKGQIMSKFFSTSIDRPTFIFHCFFIKVENIKCS